MNLFYKPAKLRILFVIYIHSSKKNALFLGIYQINTNNHLKKHIFSFILQTVKRNARTIHCKITDMNRILIVFIFLLNTILGISQQIIPEIIDETVYLTSQNSPYLIEDNTEITVSGELIIEKGVTIFINPNKTITNNGRLIINGTKSKPINFTCIDENLKWKYIKNENTLIANNVFITNAVRFVDSHGDTLILKSCNVSETYGTIGDDLVGAHYAKKIVIKNCCFKGNPNADRIDAIDLDGISYDTIMQNEITGFSDDGIDIGTNSTDVFIAHNIISNCNMGVSVGETSTVKLFKNLLFFNDAGIQSHTGSIVTADRNTLYGNSLGLRAYHNANQNTSGGTINISNSIISNCTGAVIGLKENSVVSVNYCLSDSTLPSGTGNIKGDAMFFDVGANNFALTSSSPAIDAGNPDNDGDGIDYTADTDDQDIDGTRLDLGYLPFFNAPLIINEIIPANLNAVADEFGQYSDMVELFNTTNADINLKNYYVSDKRDNLTKHKITEDLIVQANSFVVLWADKLENDTVTHLPFKLSGGGESFAILDANENLIDVVDFSWVPVNMSFGRSLTSRQWVYFENATPLQPNAVNGKDGISESPAFSNDGGETTFPVNIGLSTTADTDNIFYSTDGSNPVNGSAYSSEFMLNQTTTVRTVNKGQNTITCFPETRIFYLQNEVNLPVLSISTNHENLYGDNGIYTNYNSSGVNWERTSSIGYYNNSYKFGSTAGIRIQGGNSVHMAKKSFRLFFRGGYGSSKLYASPFKDGPSSFENLVLRSGYDDDITTSTGTLLRDPLSVEYWGMLGELATQSDWVALFLNNSYWGIYNIRESINEHFVEDNLGIDDFDLVRFQKWGISLKYGSIDTWNELIDFFEVTDFTRPEAYDETAAFMDMNSLLNLLSFVHCSQFRSWTWGAFGIKPLNGKWSWTIWDTDRGYSMLNWNGFTEYSNTNAEKWPNFIPQELIKNEKFKIELINRVCDLLNTTFKEDNALAVFNSLADAIEPEMDNEFDKWNSGNISKWDTNTDNIRNFLQKRPDVVRQQMLDYFGISDSILINIKTVGRGRVKINSITLSKKDWYGIYMSDIPIKLEAIADFGSKFIGWEDIGTNNIITITSSANKTITAVFENTTVDHYPLVINEIMYHPVANSGNEWIELYNPNDYNVPMHGYMFTDGGAGNSFEFTNGTTIDAHSYLIVAESIAEFTSYFQQISTTLTGDFGSGATGFLLSNSGEKLLLFNNGVLEDSVFYDDNYPWSENADGNGSSLQLRSYELNNAMPESWVANTNELCTPGKQNITSIYNQTPYNFNVLVYPNPFCDNINIVLTNVGSYNVDLSIYDVMGRKVSCYSSITTIDTNAEININTDIYKRGIYILKIVLDNGTYSKAIKLIRF